MFKCVQYTAVNLIDILIIFIPEFSFIYLFLVEWPLKFH